MLPSPADEASGLRREPYEFNVWGGGGVRISGLLLLQKDALSLHLIPLCSKPKESPSSFITLLGMKC